MCDGRKGNLEKPSKYIGLLLSSNTSRCCALTVAKLAMGC